MPPYLDKNGVLKCTHCGETYAFEEERLKKAAPSHGAQTMKLENYWLFGLTLLGSGWLIALYFATIPGYLEASSQIPQGAVIGITSPNLYLIIAFLINTSAFVMGIIQDSVSIPA